MSKFKSAHIIGKVNVAGYIMYNLVLLEEESFEPYKDIGGKFTGYMVASISEAMAIAAKHNVPLYIDGKEVTDNPVKRAF